MNIQFYKKNGEKSELVEYPKNLVSEVLEARLLEYLLIIRNNARTSNAHTKDRSQVSGGGAKPWRQKGTGRARAGSSRSPIWTGGGVTFGPTNNKNYSGKLNKKEKKAALLGILYSKVSDKIAIGISDLKLSTPKTKEASSALSNLPISGKTTIFLAKDDFNSEKSFRNIPYVFLAKANKINPISLLSSDSVIFTKESLAELEKNFSAGNKSEGMAKLTKLPTKTEKLTDNKTAKKENE